jgi:hypothetical protein
MIFGAGLTLACYVSLSGCAKAPDQQVPIQLRPGQYAVEITGSMLGISAGDSGTSAFPKSLCLAGSDDDIMREVSSLFAAFMPANSGCSISRPERRGNAIAASSSCPLDGKFGAGTSKIAFDAVVVTDGIDGAYSFKIDRQRPVGDSNQHAQGALSGGLLAAYKLDTHFHRTGECTGGSGSAGLPSNPWARK